MKRYFALFLALIAALTALLTALSSCTSGAGVSSACVGYAAGEGEEALFWHAEDRFCPPIEFVRAYILLCALEEDETIFEEDLPMRIVYAYDDVYLRALLERVRTDPDKWLAAINDYARSLGMTDTVFTSLTGTAEGDNALRAAFSLPEKEHVPNVTTLKDLLCLGRALYERPAVRALYAGYTATFAGSSQEKTRNVPLLRPSSDLYLPDARMALGGWCKTDGSVRYVALAAVEADGKKALSAVAARTNGDDALLYASCDAGNLCGKCLGKDYGLEYLPAAVPGGAGVTVGWGIFHRVILIILALAILLAVVLIVVGAIVRFKRNREGRKKYMHEE